MKFRPSRQVISRTPSHSDMISTTLITDRSISIIISSAWCARPGPAEGGGAKWGRFRRGVRVLRRELSARHSRENPAVCICMAMGYQLTAYRY